MELEETSTQTTTTESSEATTTTASTATTTGTTTTAEPQVRRYDNKKRYEKGDREFEKNDRDGHKKKFFKRKVCHFCKNKIAVLDYKDIKTLRRYVKDSGKIIPKRLTGTCSKHQRMVTSAIKRARNIALLPYETKY